MVLFVANRKKCLIVITKDTLNFQPLLKIWFQKGFEVELNTTSSLLTLNSAQYDIVRSSLWKLLETQFSIQIWSREKFSIVFSKTWFQKGFGVELNKAVSFLPLSSFQYFCVQLQDSLNFQPSILLTNAKRAFRIV